MNKMPPLLSPGGTYAPSKASGAHILAYQRAIAAQTSAQLSALNAAAAANPAAAPPQLAALNASWTKAVTNTKDHVYPSTTVEPGQVLPLANQTTAMYMANSAVSFGP